MAFLSSISQCTMSSQSHQMQIMVFLGWRSGLTLVFGISQGATHSFLCFIFIYRHHFSSPVMIRYKKLFVIACCSMVGEILRSNMKAIFFVVFTKLMRHPDSQFFSKIPLNEDDWKSFFIVIHFFGQFMTYMAIFLLQKCFEMVFVKFKRSSAAGCVVDVKIAIFKLCKPFSCHRFAYDTFPVYHAKSQAASAAFWP